MIPSDLADTTTQALDTLVAQNPPNSIGEAVKRLKQVVSAYTGDDDAFNPVDFTESDLSEGTKIFESAARKEVGGYFEATRSAHSAFRAGMNKAQGSRERTKCRATQIIDLAAVVAEKI